MKRKETVLYTTTLPSGFVLSRIRYDFEDTFESSEWVMIEDQNGHKVCIDPICFLDTVDKLCTDQDRKERQEMKDQHEAWVKEHGPGLPPKIVNFSAD